MQSRTTQNSDSTPFKDSAKKLVMFSLEFLLEQLRLLLFYSSEMARDTEIWVGRDAMKFPLLQFSLL